MADGCLDRTKETHVSAARATKLEYCVGELVRSSVMRCFRRWMCCAVTMNVRRGRAGPPSGIIVVACTGSDQER